MHSYIIMLQFNLKSVNKQSLGNLQNDIVESGNYSFLFNINAKLNCLQKQSLSK